MLFSLLQLHRPLQMLAWSDRLPGAGAEAGRMGAMWLWVEVCRRVGLCAPGRNKFSTLDRMPHVLVFLVGKPRQNT